MLTYNTQLEHIVLPEYGRNIQKMVEYCMTLPEKADRNSCAAAIVKSIINLKPELKNSPEEIDKLWDHLAIISGFKLDIDYPHEVIDETKFHSVPEPVPYGRSNTKMKHYGHLIEVMIQQCASMEESAERDELIANIANQMKKTIVVSTNEDVDDEKIFNDIAMMSGGAIRIDPSALQLPEYKHTPQPTGKKKKKK